MGLVHIAARVASLRYSNMEAGLPETAAPLSERADYGQQQQSTKKDDEWLACQNHTAHDDDCNCANTGVAKVNGQEMPYKVEK